MKIQTTYRQPSAQAFVNNAQPTLPTSGLSADTYAPAHQPQFSGIMETVTDRRTVVGGLASLVLAAAGIATAGSAAASGSAYVYSAQAAGTAIVNRIVSVFNSGADVKEYKRGGTIVFNDGSYLKMSRAGNGDVSASFHDDTVRGGAPLYTATFHAKGKGNAETFKPDVNTTWSEPVYGPIPKRGGRDKIGHTTKNGLTALSAISGYTPKKLHDMVLGVYAIA